MARSPYRLDVSVEGRSEKLKGLVIARWARAFAAIGLGPLDAFDGLWLTGIL